MLCHICQKNEATVHITEIESFPVNGSDPATSSEPVVDERHICEHCAHRGKVPFSGVTTNKGLAVWHMLKESARRAREESSITCPECGMTMAEFRSKGRLGCARDYEIFRSHVQPLLLRIHNATVHKGRLPHLDEAKREELEIDEHLTGLRKKLEEAIRAEAYESAAQLRDEIENLASVQKDPR